MKGGGRSSRAKRVGLVAGLLLALIRIYQLSLSMFMGRMCRHAPSCSAYAAEAIQRHGAWAGFWLGFFRVCRCHPWGTHGFDPVPEEVPPRALDIRCYAGYGRKLD